MDGFFGDLFDMDGNGELDSVEHAVDFMVFEEMVNEDKTQRNSYEYFDTEDEDEYEDEYEEYDEEEDEEEDEEYDGDEDEDEDGTV